MSHWRVNEESALTTSGKMRNINAISDDQESIIKVYLKSAFFLIPSTYIYSPDKMCN